MNLQDKYRPAYQWSGRSLANYKAMNPKAKEAKTLTEARKLAFGEKRKRVGCACRQAKCARASGGKESHC